MTTKIWRGSAPSVPQVDRLVPTLAQPGDTYTVTVGNKTYTYTLDYADLVEDPTYGWCPSLINHLIDALTTYGGTVPEFGEITWTADLDPNGQPIAIIATGPDDGTPVTISCGEANVAGGMGVGTEVTTEGDGVSVSEVQTIAIHGMATGGTFTLTFNGYTTSGIAYNASAATVDSALEALTSIGSGNVVVTGSAGGPWTVTFGGTLANTDVDLIIGDGASLTGADTQTFTLTNVTTASGPHWFTTAANWSTGTAPADNDVLIFENSSVPCKYGLSNASVTPERIIVRASYTGQIGLPIYNGTYAEYRDTALVIGSNGDGSASTIDIEIGAGPGDGCPLIRLNTGTKQTSLSIYSTGSSSEQYAPAVNWVGTHVSNTVSIVRGSVGIAAFSGQTAVALLVNQGFLTSQDGDTYLTIGAGATVTTLVKSGGDLVSEGRIVNLQHSGGTASIGGTYGVDTIEHSGGTIWPTTSGVLGKYGTITGITKANPAVVTSNTHGLSPGDKVRISGSDMAEVNNLEFTVGVVAANTFQLLATDSSAYAAAGTSGTWAKLETVVVSGTGVLDFNRSLDARQVAAPIVSYVREGVQDRFNAVTTLTYPSGQLALDYRGVNPSDGLGPGLYVRS